MSPVRKRVRLGLFAAISLAVATVSTPASAEVRQVDGHLWKDSSTEQKQAYLVGVANLLAVDSAYKQKKGTVDPNSPLARYLRGTDPATLVQVQQRIDSWYSANSSRLDVPVLGVLWYAFVQAER